MALIETKPAQDGSNRVVVFISGVAPTPEERALAKEHGTKCFRSLAFGSTSVVPHRYAVALDPKRIPEKYTREPEAKKAEKKPLPASPFVTTPVVATGPRGIAAD